MAAWKRFALVLSGALVVIGLIAGPAAADELADEAQFVQMINQSRSAAGLAPLTIDQQLLPGARTHSGAMAQRGTIFHNPGLAASVPDDWMRLGENVGMGGSVGTLHDAFMNSPGHRANVLGDYDRVGIGIVMSGPVMFVTEVFWKTAPVQAPAAVPQAAPAPSAAQAQAATPAPAPVAAPAAPALAPAVKPAAITKATKKKMTTKSRSKAKKGHKKVATRRSARRARR
jgi:hypothetical protein